MFDSEFQWNKGRVAEGLEFITSMQKVSSDTYTPEEAHAKVTSAV